MVTSMGAQDAAIVRLFGYATVNPVQESPLAELLLDATADNIELPVRQAVDVNGRRHADELRIRRSPIFEFVSQRLRSERGRRYMAKTVPSAQARADPDEIRQERTQ